MSVEKATNKLSAYITIRGEIAHRVQHTEGVKKVICTKFRDFAERLVDKTDASVRQHIEPLTGRLFKLRPQLKHETFPRHNRVLQRRPLWLMSSC